MNGVDDVTWLGLALTLTLLCGIVAFFSYRRRGAGAGLRWTGLALAPIGLYLVGLMRTAGRIADALADWAGDLVFRPSVWIGVAVLVVSALLFVGGGLLSARRDPGPRRSRREPGHVPAGDRSPELQPRARQEESTGEFDDIEALLRKHGIE